MIHLRRRRLNLVTAVSLLLLPAVAAEWAFNRRSIHGVTLGAPSGFGIGRCRPVGFYVAVGSYLRPPHPRDVEPWMHERAWRLHWQGESLNTPDSLPGSTTLGFGAGTFNTGVANDPNSHVRYAVIPYWFLAAAAAGPPAGLVLRRWRHRHRAAGGLCPSCGYDLRATPDRCPECGTIAATPHTA